MAVEKKNKFHEVKVEYLKEKAKLFAPWYAFSLKQGDFWEQYAWEKRAISLSEIDPGYKVNVVDTEVEVKDKYNILSIKEVEGLGKILENAFAVAAIFESGVQFLSGLSCKDRNDLEKVISRSLKSVYKPSYGKVLKLRLVVDPKGKKQAVRDGSTRSKIKAFSERMQWIEQTFEFNKTYSLPLERVKGLYLGKFGLRPKKEFSRYIWNMFLEYSMSKETGVVVILLKKGIFQGVRERDGS
jgi:hypothetical protein